MKKLISFVLLAAVAFVAAGCKSTPYNRTEEDMSYERYMSKYILAACGSTGKPYAMYSLAKLNRKPVDGDPRYKVTFINGPCEGKTGYTQDVITRTMPMDGIELKKGMVVVRNFWNPREAFSTKALDRWHKAVVYDTDNVDSKGTVVLEFPRDKNDFMAARENIYLHNIRYIAKPRQQAKDPRVILQ